MASFLDLFDFDGGEGRSDRDGRPRRKGPRGLVDRLTRMLADDGDDDERERPGKRDERVGGEPPSRRREHDSSDFFD